MCALQTLIRRKPVLYRLTSIFKVCKNLLSQPVPPPLKPAAAATAATATGIGCFKRYENPCVDLYFNVRPDQPVSESCAFLDRLLPPAWSHNPLTTLKVIRAYSGNDLYEWELYAKAVYWLHHNHPKTLAFNIPFLQRAAIVEYYCFIRILYNVLGLKSDFYPYEGHVIDHFRTAIRTQPDFRFLHDLVSDFFAEGLKFDIQSLKNHDHDDENAIMEITNAAEVCIDAPFLLESVAKRLFPDCNNVEEAVERLRKEVLEPLNKVVESTQHIDDMINRWGYRCAGPDETKDPMYLCWKYLKEVKESSSSVDKMVSNAMLPHQIVKYASHVGDGDLSQVIELQWKIMVQDLKKKYKERMQGILSHSLIVIHPKKLCTSLEMSLTILMSELSVEEAWKGKFIPLIPKPRLELIQGDDLKSKIQFLGHMDEVVTKDIDEYTDFKSVFDLILQEAVDKGLKPDQMIKRLYVVTGEYDSFTWISRRDWVDENDEDEEVKSSWEVQDYEEMKSKYKEHEYDMPHIMFWRICCELEHVQQSPDERGIVTMTGLLNYPNDAEFINIFLENDGEMSPQHIMEANTAHQDFDRSLLAVLD